MTCLPLLVLGLGAPRIKSVNGPNGVDSLPLWKRDLAWNCALRGGATDNELELLKGLTALRNQFSHQSDAWAKPPSSQDNPASGP